MSGGLNHLATVRHFFDSQAATWADQYTSGLMTDRAPRFIAVLREHVVPGAAVLDLGCGSGDITLAVAAHGWRTTGCDISPNMLAVAAARAGAGAITWVPLLDPTLPFVDGMFDAVYSSSVLEYVEDAVAHLREVARILRPGGWYIATVPDMRHPARATEERKRRRSANKLFMAVVRQTRWAAQYEYLRGSINRWSLERWAKLFRNAGLTPGPIPGCDHPLALLTGHKL